VCLDEENSLLVSAATVWELQIKESLGKLNLRTSVKTMVNDQLDLNGLKLLPVSLGHIWELANLPRLHGDPFDRMLMAQARHEGLTIVSADKIMREYPVEVLWE
jgi:PIN domain nuclease of toxin-antitoxin system